MVARRASTVFTLMDTYTLCSVPEKSFLSSKYIYGSKLFKSQWDFEFPTNSKIRTKMFLEQTVLRDTSLVPLAMGEN